MKKGIAVLLAALMLASVWLVGCGERSPEELWATAKENIVTAKSVRLHMTTDMAFDLQGETTSMTMKMEEACTQDPLSAEVTMTMDMGRLGKMDTTMYLVQEGKEYVSYTKVSGGILGDEDVGWSRSTIDVTDLKQYNAMDNAKLYLDVLNSFQSAGKEAIGSYNTIRYDGKVTGQDISKMLDTLGDNVSSMPGSVGRRHQQKRRCGLTNFDRKTASESSEAVFCGKQALSKTVEVPEKRTHQRLLHLWRELSPQGD